MDGDTTIDWQATRKKLAGSLGDLHEIHDLHRTTEGRGKLRHSQVLRDDEHYARFCRSPGEIQARARRALLSDPERIAEANRICPGPGFGVELHDFLGIGWIDASVVEDEDGTLAPGGVVEGFTIPIFSGTGLPVGIDIVGPDGGTVAGYEPPDGLYLPNHEEWPRPLLDAVRDRDTQAPVASYFVAGLAPMVAAARLGGGSVVGYQGRRTVHFDIAEAVIARPVLVCGFDYAFTGHADPATVAIVDLLRRFGLQVPPVRSWEEVFGGETQAEVLAAYLDIDETDLVGFAGSEESGEGDGDGDA